MEANYWQQRWENNDIGFHRHVVHPRLVDHLGRLSLKPQSRLFLPLCGKTLDIGWLLGQGYRMVGVELNQQAIVQLFAELGLNPRVTQAGRLKRYQAENLDVFVGDLFDLSDETLGVVDAIYDRAALVALPDAMRRRYAAHLIEITRRAPQLLITFEYDQQCIDGPPFSVSEEEIKEHYENSYTITLVDNAEVSGKLKGKCSATENVWHLQNPVVSLASPAHSLSPKCPRLPPS
jgi:thiopurine S-methyltransferase